VNKQQCRWFKKACGIGWRVIKSEDGGTKTCAGEFCLQGKGHQARGRQRGREAGASDQARQVHHATNRYLYTRLLLWLLLWRSGGVLLGALARLGGCNVLLAGAILQHTPGHCKLAEEGATGQHSPEI